jgi:hypothetical protein
VLLNLKRIDDMPANIRFSITPTISALNIHHLPEMVKWLQSSGFKKVNPDLGTHLLFYPEWFSVQVLPLAAKVKIRKMFENLPNATHFSGVLDFMDQKDRSDLLPAMISALEILDRKQNRSFRRELPALEGLLLSTTVNY